MVKEFQAAAITQFHDRMLAAPGWPLGLRAASLTGPWGWLEANHRYNALLWDEEDQARRTDVEAGAIAACKRRIDRYNQARNDAVEALDEAILAGLAGFPRAADARLHSESAGAMVDRLSILALKIHHMGEQARRRDAGADHVAACVAKLKRLRLQRRDLGVCFDALLAEARQGRAYFKVYRQFKMYNDPALNPYLYGRGAGGAARGEP